MSAGGGIACAYYWELPYEADSALIVSSTFYGKATVTFTSAGSCATIAQIFALFAPKDYIFVPTKMPSRKARMNTKPNVPKEYPFCSTTFCLGLLISEFTDQNLISLGLSSNLASSFSFSTSGTDSWLGSWIDVAGSDLFSSILLLSATSFRMKGSIKVPSSVLFVVLMSLLKSSWLIFDTLRSLFSSMEAQVICNFTFYSSSGAPENLIERATKFFSVGEEQTTPKEGRTSTMSFMFVLTWIGKGVLYRGQGRKGHWDLFLCS